MSGYKVDILITHLLVAIGDEVSGLYNGGVVPVLMLLQDVRHSHLRRQDNHPILERYRGARKADVGRPRLMSDYEVTLVNDNSKSCLGSGCPVLNHLVPA